MSTVIEQEGVNSTEPHSTPTSLKKPMPRLRRRVTRISVRGALGAARARPRISTKLNDRPEEEVTPQQRQMFLIKVIKGSEDSQLHKSQTLFAKQSQPQVLAERIWRDLRSIRRSLERTRCDPQDMLPFKSEPLMKHIYDPLESMTLATIACERHLNSLGLIRHYEALDDPA